MADIFCAPPGFEPPALNINTWQRDESDYLERLRAHIRDNNPQDDEGLLGVVIKIPHADGYAQYMVGRIEPFSLIHLELGDAWRAHAATERGLILDDARQAKVREQTLKRLFGQ